MQLSSLQKPHKQVLQIVAEKASRLGAFFFLARRNSSVNSAVMIPVIDTGIGQHRMMRRCRWMFERKMMFRLGRMFLAVSILAACASLTEEQCLEGNWFGIGQRDGIRGASFSRLKDHVKACSEVGIVPNQSLWEEGRRDGLQRYCTPASAYQIGRRGRPINNVCSTAQYNAMQAAFSHGQHYYELTREIEDLEIRIRELRGDIAAEIEANDGVVNNEVFFIETDIRDLDRRIRRLERQRHIYAVWP